MISFTYLIYIVLYEGGIWVGSVYLVGWKGWNPWWILLAALLSAGAFKPSSWAEMLRPAPTHAGGADARGD
jgi:hypothetical protein